MGDSHYCFLNQPTLGSHSGEMKADSGVQGGWWGREWDMAGKRRTREGG